MRTIDEMRLRRIEGLVHSVPLFTLLVSLEGRVELVNRIGRSLVGIPDSLDVTTLTAGDIFLEGIPPGLLGLDQQADPETGGRLGGGSDRGIAHVASTWSGPSVLRDRRTGRGIHVDVISFVVGDPATGEPAGIAVLQRDPGRRLIPGSGNTDLASVLEHVFEDGVRPGPARVDGPRRAIAALQSEAAALGLIARGTPIGGVVEHVAAALAAETGATGSVVLLCEETPTGAVLRRVAQLGAPKEAAPEEPRLDDERSPYSLAARTRSPVVLAGADASAGFPACLQVIDPGASSSIVVVPVLSPAQGEALGVVAVTFATSRVPVAVGSAVSGSPARGGPGVEGPGVEGPASGGRPFPAPASPVSGDRSGADIVEALERAATIVAIAVEHSASERRLAYEATHDQLTGLLNRALLLDRLALSIERARRDESLVPIVLFIDLDRLKVLNDSLGHQHGDGLLVIIAERLRRMFRSSDAVARFGGDEFVVVAEVADAESAPAEIAERLLQAVSEPVLIAGREFVPSASTGVVVATGYDSPQDVIRDADIAMYRAKESGGGTYRLFDPAMGARVLARLELEREIRTGVDRGEFVLGYQPVVDLGSGKVVGLEALLRWEHPERGLLEPDEFIVIAEESGLIVPIGESLLLHAARTVAAFPAFADPSGTVPRTLSVNLSARQLAAPGLLAGVAAAISALGEWELCIELTEAVLMTDGSATRLLIESLAAAGAQLCVDDFGSGRFSLSYLSVLPVTALKIDRSIVSGLGSATPAETIATAIIGLADRLRMRVVAEGVETEAQASLLRALGCGYAQGYYFHRPLSSEAASALLLG